MKGTFAIQRPLKLLTLWDNIGVCRQALKEVQIPVYEYHHVSPPRNPYFVKHPRQGNKITMFHHPETKFYIDTGHMAQNNTLRHIDLLTVNFYSRVFSLSGKQYGYVEDAYSALKHCKKVFDRTVPKYYLLSNVAVTLRDKEKIERFFPDCRCYVINHTYFSAQAKTRYYWTNIPLPNDSLEIYGKRKDEVLVDIFDENTTHVWKKLTDFAPGLQKRILKHQRDITDKSLAITPTGRSLGCHGATSIYDADSDRYRALSCLELERLQTLPDNYTDHGVAPTDRIKLLGYSWTLDVVKFILNYLPYC